MEIDAGHADGDEGGDGPSEGDSPRSVTLKGDGSVVQVEPNRFQ